MKRDFGILPDGAKATLYTLTGGGLTATVTDYGAHLVSVMVPDKNGKIFLRLELCGVAVAESMPDLRELEGIERDGICSLQLIDSTLCLPDKSFLEKDTSLRGEFYRSLRSELYSEDISKRRLALNALRIGLAAIDGKDFTQGGTV